jgi:hypothetical protein
MSFRPGEAQNDLAAAFLSLSNSWCAGAPSILAARAGKRAICVAIEAARKLWGRQIGRLPESLGTCRRLGWKDGSFAF